MRLMTMVVAAMFAASTAQAQGYPDKPIHIVVPFSPGTPEIRERLGALGADAAPMPAAEFDKLIARELVENAALAKEAGIKPQ